MRSRESLEKRQNGRKTNEVHLGMRSVTAIGVPNKEVRKEGGKADWSFVLQGSKHQRYIYASTAGGMK